MEKPRMQMRVAEQRPRREIPSGVGRIVGLAGNLLELLLVCRAGDAGLALLGQGGPASPPPIARILAGHGQRVWLPSRQSGLASMTCTSAAALASSPHPANTRSARSRRAPGASSGLPAHLHAEAHLVVRGPARRRDLDHAGVVVARARGLEVAGPSIRPTSSAAPIVLVQVAVATSTVSPTGGSLPFLPGLRLPDHATS